MSQFVTLKVDSDDDAQDVANEYLDELQTMITALNIKYISKDVIAEITATE